jgi:hypothetical protein
LAAKNAWMFSQGGSAFIGSRLTMAALYSLLARDSLSSIPNGVDTLRQGDPSNPSTYLSTATSLTGNMVPGLAGGYVGAMSDASQLASMFARAVVPNNSVAHSNSMQVRGAAVGVYNAVAGSSNANKLWVTPSGAVVTWGGTIVAPPLKQ